jgi:hypothetical protein
MGMDHYQFGQSVGWVQRRSTMLQQVRMKGTISGVEGCDSAEESDQRGEGLATRAAKRHSINNGQRIDIFFLHNNRMTDVAKGEWPRHCEVEILAHIDNGLTRPTVTVMYSVIKSVSGFPNPSHSYDTATTNINKHSTESSNQARRAES